MLLFVVVLTGCSDNDDHGTKNYKLNISVEGQGEVKNSGRPTSENREVTLTAEPQQGADDWGFDHWAGDIDGDKNPVTIVAQEKMQIKAYFSDAPNFKTSVADKKYFPGEKIEFKVEANDSDSDNLTYNVVEADDKLAGSFDPQTQTLTHPGITTAGDYKLRFEVSDGELTTEKEIVIGINGPPIIESVEQKSEIQSAATDGYEYKAVEVTEGEELLIEVRAKDPNGIDKLKYEFEGAVADKLTEVTDESNTQKMSNQSLVEMRQFTWTPSYDLVEQGSKDYGTLITVTDGMESTNRKIVIIVNHKDRPPVIESKTETSVTEESKLNFVVSASDPDGDSVTLSAANLPQGANFNAETGEFSWQPGSETSGEYEVTFAATAGGKTTNQTVKINVNELNRSPVITAIENKTVAEGKELNFTVTANDADGDELSYQVSELPEGTNFDEATGEFTWQPSQEQQGNYKLEFSASDGQLKDTEVVMITVGDVNRPPQLENVSDQEIGEGKELSFTITASDPDGDNVTLSAASLPQGANFKAETGEFTWTPGYQQAGSYELEFSAQDGTTTASEMMKIRVKDNNQPPVLEPIEVPEVSEGEELQLNLSANDADGDEIKYRVENAPEGAEFDQETGEFTWTPNYDQAGEYQLAFVVESAGQISKEQVTMTVAKKDREPTIENSDELKDLSIEEGAELSFKLNANDPDGDEVSYSASNLPEGARLDRNTGEFAWIPSYDQAGSYELTFTINAGGKSVTQTVEITIADQEKPTEDSPPVIGTIKDKEINEGETLSFIVPASDPDGDKITLSADNLPQGAEFNAATGELIWIPSYQQSGRYELSFTAQANGKSDSQTVSVIVNDFTNYEDSPPVIADISDQEVAEGSSLNFKVTASDPDGDEVTLSAVNLPQGAEFNAETRELSWTPNYQQAGNYSFSIKAAANGKTTTEEVEVVVTNSNDLPVIESVTNVSNGNATIAEGTKLDLTVRASDANGDDLSYSLTGSIAEKFNQSKNQFTWTPGYETAGEYSLTIGVSDGKETVTQDINLVVENTDRPPEVGADSATTPEDKAVTIDLLANDSDPEGKELSLEQVNDASNGTVTKDGEGTVTYTPDEDWNGTDSFSYIVSDGNLTATGEVTVTVTPVDDPPVLDQIGDKEVDEGKELSFTVTAQDIDNQVTLSANNLPTGANFAAATGEFAWTPQADDQGSYEPTFTVEANGKSDSETITITVNDKLDGGVNPEEPPAQPTGLIGDHYNGEVMLKVDNPTGKANYMVYRSTTDDSSTAEPITDSLVDLESWKDSSVESENTYYYWVRAYNEQGLSSELSNQAQVSLLGSVIFAGLSETPAGAPLGIDRNISELQDAAGNKLSGDYDLRISSDIDGELLSQSAVTFDAGAPTSFIMIPEGRLVTPGTHQLTLEIKMGGGVVSDTVELEVGFSVREETLSNATLQLENQNQAGDTLTLEGPPGVQGNGIRLEFAATNDNIEMNYDRSNELFTIDLKDSTVSDNTSTNIADTIPPITASGDATASGNEWQASQPGGMLQGGKSEFKIFVPFADPVKESSATVPSKYSLDVDGDGTLEFEQASSVEYYPNDNMVSVAFVVEKKENILQRGTSQIIIEDVETQSGDRINIRGRLFLQQDA